ncbi:efflux RND transporter periplasmic adaptor subunit [Pseudomonas fluorescens]|uniref:efflux RND transporter periplasmic adaptor subunit n=1 Tax=Pseudomonas fluorescens TaxID=294 RepID=UPI001C37864F|nr:efflux RND transporter periplasmic adaptor subunit [Pseudomonas fluorescens]
MFYLRFQQQPRRLRWLAMTFAAFGLLLLASLGLLGLNKWRKATMAPLVLVPALTITTSAVLRTRWPLIMTASGSIVPWQEASIGTQVSGLRLVEVLAQVGDRVTQGQVLARFDTATLRVQEAELQARYEEAQATASQAAANRQRALMLKSEGGMSQMDILSYVTSAETSRAQVDALRAQLAANRLQQNYAEILAPDDGVISSRSATLGSVKNSGEELFRLICQERLEWHGELPASRRSEVMPGQHVILSLPDGRSASAQVRQLAPALDSQSRMLLVIADLDQGSPAMAGMYVNGLILSGYGVVTAVPAASVVIRDGHSYVFKVDEQPTTPKVRLQSVTTGRRQENEVQIINGLAIGERIAVMGAGLLDDGDLVRVQDAPKETQQ